MCGLVGAAGNITKSIENVFKTLLYLDTLRGEHSTGVAAINRYDGKPCILKVLGPASDLVNDVDFKRCITNTNNNVLIGHNRFATLGKITVDNAHPFDAKHIIGAHNGTLTNKWEIPNQSSYETDSEALFNFIADKGVDEAISKTAGAYALTFYDRKDKTLNLLRNKERTLFLVETKTRDCILWASEKWMLEVACKRVGVDIRQIGLLKEDTLLSFKIEKESFKARAPRKIEGKPVPVYHYQNYSTPSVSVRRTMEIRYTGKRKQGHSTFLSFEPVNPEIHKDVKEISMYSARDNESYSVGQRFMAEVSLYEERAYVIISSLRKIDNVILLEGKVKEKEYFNHKGHKVSREEFKDAYPYCSWCSVDIDPDDDDVLLLTSGDVLCKQCQKDEEVAAYL